MPSLIASGLVGLFLAPLAMAATLTVPGQYGSIQSAITASSDGDTVTVAPGVYVETIDYLGKDIVVRSTGGANVTVIDGDQLGTVVRFGNGEGPMARLEGFTIRNGLGVFELNTQILQAGGVTCIDSNPVVVDCVIVDNVGASLTFGGHIVAGAGGVGYYRANSPMAPVVAPVLDGCTIEGNRGGDSDGAEAGDGGVSIDALYVDMLGCVIRGNVGGSVTNPGVGARAGCGGVGFLGPVGGSALVDCLVEGNRGGDHQANSGTAGPGGLAVIASRPKIDRCVIRNNVGGDYYGLSSGSAGTGGIFANSSPGCEVTSCQITGNQGGTGVQMTNSVGGAGGVRVLFCSIALTNCTITSNMGGAGTFAGSGGFQTSVRPGERVLITNCIVWGNTGSGPGNDDMRQEDPPPPDVTYSIIGSGGFPGVGNVDVDPQFVDAANGNYRLLCDSPAIDAGTLGAPAFPTQDLDGDDRVLGLGVDIGADEVIVPDAVPYCLALPNSSGVATLIRAEGCGSVAANGFTLVAEGTPGTPGLFLYGPNQLQVSFGDGLRCVGGAVRRLPPSSSMGTTLRRTLNFPNTSITGGSTWNFQAWYRDLAAGGAGFNLSDGLEVTFAP